MQKARLFWILIASVAVLLFLAVLFNKTALDKVTLGRDVVAVVGPNKITTAMLNDRIWFQSGFKGTRQSPEASAEIRTKALDDLIEYELLKLEAASAGITITDEELDQYASRQNLSFHLLPDDRQALARDAARQRYLKERVLDKKISWAEGEYVTVPFFVYVYSDPARYRSDKEYANQLAGRIYADLQSGKIDIGQAGARVSADSRLGLAALTSALGWENYQFSGRITKESYLLAEPGEGPYSNLLLNAAPGVHGPVLGQMTLSSLSPNEDGTPVDAVYTILKVSQRNPGQYNSVAAWRSAAEGRHKVTRYI